MVKTMEKQVKAAKAGEAEKSRKLTAKDADGVISDTVAATSGHSAASVEIRSVNGRFLDLALRLPDELRSLEPALRELLTATFRRGTNTASARRTRRT